MASAAHTIGQKRSVRNRLNTLPPIRLMSCQPPTKLAMLIRIDKGAPSPMKCCSNHLQKLSAVPMSRRQMLRNAGFGFGAWALLDLLGRESALAIATPAAALNPLAAK